ncbi:MAG TPA: IS982 family transposase [Actinomycetes bacterium]|nr:IS982 family transposase [Actinomycetes bacterium]
MHATLDDLVIALYVTIDDLLGPRLGPGHPPKLSDAELVCLAVAQALLGARSERHWLRFVRDRLGHLFPYVPGQSGYNKRLRAAAHHLSLAIRHLAMAAPSWEDGFRLLDATPLPCGASRATVKRSALWPHAGYGYDRSHSRWYWGFKLYLLCAPDGMPITWCLATPKLGEREVAQVLLDDAARQRALAEGTIILADKGLAGRALDHHIGALGAFLVRPDRADEPYRFGSLGGMRQWIESVINTLKDQLGLEQHRGRTLGGVFVRVAQRLLALAACVWWNWETSQPDKRCLVAYDH